MLWLYLLGHRQEVVWVISDWSQTGSGLSHTWLVTNRKWSESYLTGHRQEVDWIIPDLSQTGSGLSYTLLVTDRKWTESYMTGHRQEVDWVIPDWSQTGSGLSHTWLVTDRKWTESYLTGHRDCCHKFCSIKIAPSYICVPKVLVLRCILFHWWNLGLTSEDVQNISFKIEVWKSWTYIIVVFHIFRNNNMWPLFVHSIRYLIMVDWMLMHIGEKHQAFLPTTCLVCL